MDFLIGATAKVTDATDGADARKNQLEARVLAVRPARRKRREGSRADRRRAPAKGRDPVGGRVLVLMVPDGAKLPTDLADGKFRVFLRFKKH